MRATTDLMAKVDASYGNLFPKSKKPAEPPLNFKHDFSREKTQDEIDRVMKEVQSQKQHSPQSADEVLS